MRCLYLAKADLDAEVFKQWFVKIKGIESDQTLDFETKKRETAEAHKLVEKNLTFLGSTSIRDAIADEVDDTVHFLKLAGIKFWVVTGDKIEVTNVVAKEAGLIDRDTKEVTLKDPKQYSVKKIIELEELVRMRDENIKYDRPLKKLALMIGGDVIELARKEPNFVMFHRLINALDKFDVVLACRVTASQKKGVVEMMAKLKGKK